MKLSTWAKQQGIKYETAWKWFRKGILPVPARQMPTGTILVDAPVVLGGQVAVYARVSSHDQKSDLEAQVGRLAQWATANNLSPSLTVAEIGSGLNGHRRGLMRLLGNPAVTTIVVEHRDRLMRFGSEYVEASLAGRGAKLVVVDSSEVKDDLVADMIAVLTSFCARLYGRRAATNRAKKMLAAAQ